LARAAERLAGRWAAKEAVAKALGTGFASGIGLQDIETLVGPSGAPTVVLHRAAAQRLQTVGGSQVLLSIAHDGGMAVAFALIQ